MDAFIAFIQAFIQFLKDIVAYFRALGDGEDASSVIPLILMFVCMPPFGVVF